MAHRRQFDEVIILSPPGPDTHWTKKCEEEVPRPVLNFFSARRRGAPPPPPRDPSFQTAKLPNPPLHNQFMPDHFAKECQRKHSEMVLDWDCRAPYYGVLLKHMPVLT